MRHRVGGGTSGWGSLGALLEILVAKNRKKKGQGVCAGLKPAAALLWAGNLPLGAQAAAEEEE